MLKKQNKNLGPNRHGARIIPSCIRLALLNNPALILTANTRLTHRLYLTVEPC